MKIDLFSTLTKDKIIDGNTVTKKIGGPLFFIQKCFKESGVPFNTHKSELMNVEIKVKNGKENGRVLNFPKSKLIKNARHPKFIVISTVFDEWDITGLNTINKSLKIFIDIQGFVRDPHKLGGKIYWKDAEKFTKCVYCLKGNKEEIKYLPKTVIQNQKHRLLIITNGENGVEWFSRGKRYFAKTETKIKSQNTIGAGDTFFSNFVVSLYKGLSIKRSVETAVLKTTEFLKLKTYE